MHMQDRLILDASPKSVSDTGQTLEMQFQAVQSYGIYIYIYIYIYVYTGEDGQACPPQPLQVLK